MNMFATEVATNLIFTDKAARMAAELAAKRGNPNLMLRVAVDGGGCSGFQYNFDFDDVIKDDDTVVENNGVKLLIDAVSLQYVRGSEIDFAESLQGSQFVINNPNAASTCGCGTSFSI